MIDDEMWFMERCPVIDDEVWFIERCPVIDDEVWFIERCPVIAVIICQFSCDLLLVLLLVT